MSLSVYVTVIHVALYKVSYRTNVVIAIISLSIKCFKRHPKAGGNNKYS